MSADDEKDLEEEYDPSEDAVAQQQAEQDKADDEQLVKGLPDDVTASFDVDSKESVESDDATSMPMPLDEDSLIRSEAFAAELDAAIEHVSGIAKVHREEMILSIREHLKEETGMEVTESAVSLAMRTFVVSEDMELADGTTSGGEEDEEEVDEDVLDREMEEALEAVRELAAMHQVEFVDRICSIYWSLNESEASTETLFDLFRGIKVEMASEAVCMDSDNEVLDEMDFECSMLAEEMEIALEQVRKQAQLDQEGLVSFICDYHRDFNGYEPSVDILVDILGRIKEQLAEEARDEFLEMNQDEDDEEDEDYEVDEDSDAEQYAEDEAEDIYIAEEHDFDVESDVETEDEIDGDDDVRFEYLVEIEDEEELVNDPVFGELFCSAIEHIQSIGREDGVSMVLDIVEQYEEETGQRVTEEMVEVAVNVASCSTLDVEDEDVDAESEDEEELAIEMQEAVDRARELGALHKEQLVNRICDLYAEENGEEMSLQKLYAIFGDIEQGLAEEDEEDKTGELDADSFAHHFQSAIDHIQMLAKQDQEEMVDALCDIYCDYNGEEPSTPELYEMFADIKASFVEEAVEDLIENELEVIEAEYEDEDESSVDDEDYSPDSDAFDYSVDAVDDVLYHDSEYDTNSETESDSDYIAEEDTVDSVYEQDVEDDLSSSTESEVEVEVQGDGDGDVDDENEDEQKATELESQSDSEYSPDKDAFDYFEDYEADQVYPDSDVSSSTEKDSESEESESESDKDSDYDPNYDLTNYLMDYEQFQKDEAEEEEDSDDDEDYSVGKDGYDYSQDLEDDLAETSEDSKGSESEEDVADELAA